MPKLIENIRGKILQAAKSTLLSDGYDKLCLRGVARKCNIAVGTIYNYYSSKLALLVAIMLEDWTVMKEKIREACCNAENAEAGIKSIFYNLRDFASLYQDAWNMSMHSKDVRFEMLNGRSRRQMLIEQLTGMISNLLDRFQIYYDSFIPHFIATLILAYIMEPGFDYEQLNKVFRRILYVNDANGHKGD